MIHEATAKQAFEGDELALQRIRDRAEVEELLVRYTMSVDLRDWESFRSCFAERVRVRFDPPVVDEPDDAITPEEWAAFAGACLGSSHASQHYYSIYSIRLDENVAEALMYYRAGCGENVDDPPFVHSVYYTYGCQRTRGGWKIVEISAHTLPAESSERGPSSGAFPIVGRAPASDARPARRAGGKGSKRQTGESKRPQRSAAKRR